MDYRSPLDMLYHWEETTPDKVYLQQPFGDSWKTWTWKEAAYEVRAMAGVLAQMKLPPNSHVALISKNCAHWILCDLAIMMAGHVSIPLYPNIAAHTLKQILEHSDARLLFVGKLDGWNVMKEGVPEKMNCISLPFCSHTEYDTWYDLLNEAQPIREKVQRSKDETGTIIYTSGTTGISKGVVHRFNSFSFTSLHAIPSLGLTSASRFFSYLPLSHSAERSLVEMCSMYCGGEVFFVESIERFSQNLAYAKPTEFLAVHHIWKKFQERILQKLPQTKLDLLLSIPFVSAWLKMKVKKQLGLQFARNIFTGASPTPATLIKWFSALGIHIQEGYGLTENWSYSHITRKEGIRIGLVGPPLPGVEVKLADDDEIQVKHEALMSGYYKEPQKTFEAFTGDGFLRTGDSGLIGKDGYLKITGRVKDIFKTSKGNYVAPAPIELKLSANEAFEFVCVTGSGLPQPMALVVLSAIGKSQDLQQLTTLLTSLLQELNPTLDPCEKLSKLVVISDQWSIENNMLTPTFKIRRKEVEALYAPYFLQWLDSDAIVHFHHNGSSPL
ncbi:MAG TPA: AMP-binding protein [Chitinophagaceae bacterium]|nr:AMP-binding protein [Chitinophagaceae bacterium]